METLRAACHLDFDLLIIPSGISEFHWLESMYISSFYSRFKYEYFLEMVDLNFYPSNGLH